MEDGTRADFCNRQAFGCSGPAYVGRSHDYQRLGREESALHADGHQFSNAWLLGDNGRYKDEELTFVVLGCGVVVHFDWLLQNRQSSLIAAFNLT
jgi:hypothetical protein